MKKCVIYGSLVLLVQFTVFLLQVEGQSLEMRGTLKLDLKDSAGKDIICKLQFKDRFFEGVIVQQTFFHFSGLPGPGVYNLYISAPGYMSIDTVVHIPRSKERTFYVGTIRLNKKIDSLQSVTVTPHRFFGRVKQDTIEYDPSAVVMSRNATLESLLARIPGVRVAPDGSITVNGQKVERLMINGQDFFSSTPSVAARILDAARIAKIQLIDKKTDQAAISGIDDGKRYKALNLLLMDKYSQTLKADGSIGQKGHYNSNAGYVGFAGKEQLAILGMASDIGNSTVGSGENFLFANPTIQDPLGAVAGSGIPNIQSGGLQYSNGWNSPFEHVNLNYQVTHVNTSPDMVQTTIQNLPDTQFIQLKHNNSSNRKFEQNGNFSIKSAPDKYFYYQLVVTGDKLSSDNSLKTAQSSFFNQTRTNETNGSINSVNQSSQFSATLAGRLSPGKTTSKKISGFFQFQSDDSHSAGIQKFLNTFFAPVRDSTDSVNQYKKSEWVKKSASAGLSFGDSIGARGYMGLSGSVAYLKASQRQSVQNGKDGTYITQIDSLSFINNNKTLTSQAGLNYRLHLRNGVLFLSAELKSTRLLLGDDLRPVNGRYHFLTFSPVAIFSLRPDKVSSFSVTYQGESRLPSAEQLFPVQNNNDPLHFQYGNPDLKPVFAHLVTVTYNSYKRWQKASYLGINLLNGNILPRINTNSLGYQTTVPVNTKGGYSLFATNSIEHSFQEGHNTIRFIQRLQYAKTYSFVGDIISANSSLSGEGEINFARYVADNLQLSVKLSVGYYQNGSTVNGPGQMSYFTQNHTIEATYWFLKTFRFRSYFGYTWREKTSVFDKENTTALLGFFLMKDILNSKGALKFRIDNLLNTNAGINRNISTNLSSETIERSLGRVWLFSLSWRLSK